MKNQPEVQRVVAAWLEIQAIRDKYDVEILGGYDGEIVICRPGPTCPELQEDVVSKHATVMFRVNKERHEFYNITVGDIPELMRNGWPDRKK